MLLSLYELVLSSGAMKRIYPSKLEVLSLLVAFLVASVGTVFGYSWCVGDDGHVEVSYTKDSNCCVDEFNSHTVDRYDVPALGQPNGDACGLCRDFSAQQNDAVVFKRVKKVSTFPVAALSSETLSLKAGLIAQKGAFNLALQPLRVSQTILAHRTVVLLN